MGLQLKGWDSASMIENQLDYNPSQCYCLDCFEMSWYKLQVGTFMPLTFSMGNVLFAKWHFCLNSTKQSYLYNSNPL